MLRSIRKKITTAVTNKSKAINQTFQSLKNLRIISDVKLHTNLFI